LVISSIDEISFLYNQSATCLAANPGIPNRFVTAISSLSVLPYSFSLIIQGILKLTWDLFNT